MEFFDFKKILSFDWLLDPIRDKNRWSKKRRVGHKEGIAKGASYNKSIVRLIARSKKPDWARPA
jgi:hypothetical protein